MRLLLLILLTLPASARELYWDSINVKAELDAAGRLLVREQQTYVFNGDWNGGERTFRVDPEQRFTFGSISRLDDSGNLVPLTYGSLDAVDEYQLNEKVLRWRSRLPSDPPFVNQRITYVIEYTLENILVKRGDLYVLDHDFAFPDRSGDIKRFTLDIGMDPAWQALGFERHLELQNMPPGNSAIVRGTLRYTGASAPEARVSTMPMRVALAAVAVIVPFLLWGRLLHREEKLGRFVPVNSSEVNPEWIEQHILPLRAEVVGATWDEDVGQNEVSALLARWAAEEKIDATPLSGGELRMKLKVPRAAFEGYERELIDKLFFAGDDTSTSAIRGHYKDSGFNPTTIVNKPLFEKVNELSSMKDPAPSISRLPSFVLFAAAVFLLWRAFVATESVKLGIATVVIFFAWLTGIGLAMIWRGRIDHGVKEARGLLNAIGVAVIAAVLVMLLVPIKMIAHAGLAAAVLMVANNVINVAKSKKGPRAIAYRKRLAAVRQYFIEELKKSNPAIDDRWFPYVVAFGLDKEASAWVTDFGAQSRAIYTGSRSSSSSSSSSGSSSPTWTGGGGAFGGAGASGSWSAAAAGVAAGVASSSSSSGGSSGGGGSSSSGGGGGGGW